MKNIILMMIIGLGLVSCSQEEDNYIYNSETLDYTVIFDDVTVKEFCEKMDDYDNVTCEVTCNNDEAFIVLTYSNGYIKCTFSRKNGLFKVSDCFVRESLDERGQVLRVMKVFYYNENK